MKKSEEGEEGDTSIDHTIFCRGHEKWVVSDTMYAIGPTFDICRLRLRLDMASGLQRLSGRILHFGRSEVLFWEALWAGSLPFLARRHGSAAAVLQRPRAEDEAAVTKARWLRMDGKAIP